ncbi:hypothetical protein CP960_06975 [Malaciobacter halophilus]|uniref:Glycosyltransferase RgtA/B/C/D-like domain-containing protein n=1 Tax=Malaciobacter halophilus TaxID=197482 RepID=A0A2N1J340_9BACT|nr:glycosyltransferase family 39 protein [Malaciobacter halophilus]AXH10582.1 PMT family membrane protein [Malaciobacter halophilus]PKI80973.1 hypothetical protein CP960_06975 [Malaciobacter halophilus]
MIDTTNQYNKIVYTTLIVTTIVLIFVSNTLSISYKEALNFFENNSLLSLLTNVSTSIFGQNDIALRLPFITFYFSSVILIYLNTKTYFKYQSDRVASTIIFMFLPGVLSASLLVNSAIVVTFCTLFYIYYYQKTQKHNYVFLIAFLFVDNSFAIFFLAIFFYSLSKRDNLMIYVSLILFGLSMGVYGFESTGKPKGFFIDTFAIYASIFSPFLFLYFFYSLYRMGIKKQTSFIWYISATALIFSIVFSFRQKIYIEDYAPYVVIAIPLMLKLFMHSYRVRLKQFRKKHFYFALLVLITLSLNIFITIFNKPLYLVLDNPKKHFVYKYHLVKELSEKLKELNINHISSNDEELLLRLRFYKVYEGDKYFISLKKLDNYDIKIPIVYYGVEVATAYINKEDE